MIEGNCLLMLEWTATGAFLLGLAGAGFYVRTARPTAAVPTGACAQVGDTPAYGYGATREAATEAFARSW
jgi:hypothetical protein